MVGRNYKADNIRFFLIFLVVFGHLLEQFSGKYTDLLYRTIYSFHIPALIFLTGFFAKFNPRKILFSLVLPYFLFQTLYLLFQGYVIKGADTVVLSYTTPHWLLWYLLAVIFYYMLTPMLQWDGVLAKMVVFAISLVVSLLAGFDKNVGYYMSLSRFFCFLPFFVAGFYCGHQQESKKITAKVSIPVGILCIGILLVAMYYILDNGEIFSCNVLYGSYSYASENYTYLERGVLLVTGFAWIGVLFLIMPKRKLPVVSAVGKNTLPVFLFHGFIMRLLAKEGVFQYSQIANLCLAAVIALAVVLLLGNSVSAWLCKWCFTGHGLYVLTDKTKSTEKERVL